jgi:hypothetical protein
VKAYLQLAHRLSKSEGSRRYAAPQHVELADEMIANSKLVNQPDKPALR